MAILLLAFLNLDSQAARAQSLLGYPISELGFCRDAKECFLYCEIPENRPACWAYGKYRLGGEVLGEKTLEAEMEEKAKRLGITFPIAELGGCATISQCRDYCQEPKNHQACLDFAKRYGLGRYEKHPELMEKARDELGCTSQPTCRAFCDRPENQERCLSFATRHGFQTAAGKGLRKKAELLEKARGVLGCDSMESCRLVCEKKKKRCLEFMREHLPPEVEIRRQDIEEVRRRAEEIREKAEELGEKALRQAEEFRFEREDFRRKFSVGESAGCQTETECRSWCEKYPDKCPSFRESRDYERFLKKEGVFKKNFGVENEDRNEGSFENRGQYTSEEFQRRCLAKGCVFEGNVCRCD